MSFISLSSKTLVRKGGRIAAISGAESRADRLGIFSLRPMSNLILKLKVLLALKLFTQFSFSRIRFSRRPPQLFYGRFYSQPFQSYHSKLDRGERIWKRRTVLISQTCLFLVIQSSSLVISCRT